MTTARPHPLVAQLRFARSEFRRGVEGVSDEDGAVRLGPMNCLAWNVGHLAWQEQRYFLTLAQELEPFPDIQALFRYGAPGFQPRLGETLATWSAVTAAADAWLDGLTTEALTGHFVRQGKPLAPTVGSLILRTVYHYWYHCGENQAIRQQLGHPELPQYVGDIDAEAPYTPEGA